MKRTVEAEEGRLDAVVARITGAARADVQRAIAAGTVRVDGAPRPKSFRLHGGERLTIEIDPDAPLTAEGPPVPIRYEDDQLAVVAKPAGLVTHPTAARRSGTLVNRLLGMGVPLAPAGGALRPGIVHRLDAGTSGLLVVAKTDEAYTALRRLFHDHTVERGYVALVRGASGTTPSPSTRRSDGGRRRSWWTRPKDARRRHGSRCGSASTAPPSSRPCLARGARIDPGPPGGDRPSDPRGSRLRGRGRRRPQSGTGSPIPPRRPSVLRAPDHAPDGHARRRAPGGPSVGPAPTPRAARLTAPGGDASVGVPRITGM